MTICVRSLCVQSKFCKGKAQGQRNHKVTLSKQNRRLLRISRPSRTLKQEQQLLRGTSSRSATARRYSSTFQEQPNQSSSSSDSFCLYDTMADTSCSLVENLRSAMSVACFSRFSSVSPHSSGTSASTAVYMSRSNEPAPHSHHLESYANNIP